MWIFLMKMEKRFQNKKGELVIKKPFPTMPIKFWNDQKKIKNLKMHILQNIKIFGTMETLFKRPKMEVL